MAIIVMTPASGAAPDAKKLGTYLGRYEFVPGTTVEVRRASAGLEIESKGHDSMYLPAGKPVTLSFVAGDEYELNTSRADRLRFERDARGRISALTIAPGPWPVRAERQP